jgi:hypothetical protein
MKAPPSAIHVLRIILTSLYNLVNIRYGSLTVSRRKRISHEPRGAEALTHKSLTPREHILGLDTLHDAFPHDLEGTEHVQLATRSSNYLVRTIRQHRVLHS